MAKFLFSFLIVMTAMVMSSNACGCGIPADIDGNSANGCSSDYVCDGCPPCNTCNQLFSGCLSPKFKKDVTCTPDIPSVLALNQPIEPIILSSPSQDSQYWIDVCVNPSLPAGLSIAFNGNKFVLSGTPTEVLKPITYTFYVKGSANFLSKHSYTFAVQNVCNGNTGGNSTTLISSATVIASTGTTSGISTPTDTVCTQGYQRCVSGGYETCYIYDANTQTYTWGPVQPCGDGTTCQPFNSNYITCA